MYCMQQTWLQEKESKMILQVFSSCFQYAPKSVNTCAKELWNQSKSISFSARPKSYKRAILCYSRPIQKNAMWYICIVQDGSWPIKMCWPCSFSVSNNKAEVQLQSLIVITTRRLVDLQVDVVEKIMQDQGTEFLAVKLALSYGFLWKLWAVQLQ